MDLRRFFKQITATLGIFFIAAAPLAQLEAGLWDQLKSGFVKPAKPKPKTIRVLIVDNADSATVEAFGRHIVWDPNPELKPRDHHLRTHFSSKNSTVCSLPSGVKWGEEFVDSMQIQIIPQTKKGKVIVNGVPYSGSVSVYSVKGTEKIAIVNQVDIEDYLESTLCATVDKELELEALAAIAIAARTQAYYQSVCSKNKFWDVRADAVHYEGSDIDPLVCGVLEAVDSTKYMVMSQTGTYERVITPFAVKLVFGETDLKGKIRGFSVEEAESLARRGDTASKILNQVFPNTTIELAFNPTSYPKDKGQDVTHTAFGNQSSE